MKRTAFALSFLCIIILLQNTSCVNGNKYRKEAQMLDSLQILVIKADSDVIKIDSAKITGYGNHVMNDMQLLQMNHTDSMSSASAEIFRNFNQLRWSLLTTAGKRGPLLRELAKSQKQLSHLSHDLQHNMVPADSAQIFIANESKKAEELVQVSNMSVTEVTKLVPLYISLAPKADSLISLVQNHKKI
ncbi:MAG TPA: hypothetical protein VK808_04305 [Bacteroidia bacterium]|nr:hypothetical protein [Bacteroidia bacterium]